MPRKPISYKSRDRGPVEIESKLHEETTEIMKIVRKDFITISPSFPIKEASEKMVKNGIRRLPVVSPGTKELLGMVVSRDIVDFLGGGEKHQIISKKHEGNFLSAINDSSKMIMNPEAPYVEESTSIPEVAELMLESGVGGVPVLDEKKRMKGIITERDFANYIPSPARTRVERHMSKDPITADPDLFLIDAMKKMISEGFRRLPVVKDGKIVGILTSMDILEYFGSNEIFKNLTSNDAHDAISVEIGGIMTKDPITADPKADLGETARKMGKSGYGGFPVVENGELVGIITEQDILELLI